MGREQAQFTTTFSTDRIHAVAEPNIMPSWIITVITVLSGSSIVAVILGHVLQQWREREKEKRTSQAIWVARQRELCAGLLEVVIRNNQLLNTAVALHDNRASRLSAKKTLELALQDLLDGFDTVRKVRRDLDLEPNAELQEAIERYGDAAIAYHQALLQPISSPWNPVQFYLGKTPPEELRPLAEEFHVRTKELQVAVRGYLARIDPPSTARHRTWTLWRHSVK